MANPDYKDILSRLAAATTEEDRRRIEEELTFTEELTKEDIELFNYIFSGYIEDPLDPVVDDEIYPKDGKIKLRSYVGVFYSENQT